MALIGFIGIGNMGYPMLLAAMKEFGKEEVLYISADMNQMDAVKKETGVSYAKSSIELLNECRYIVLAVKPQQYKKLFDEIRDAVHEDHIILSPMAGVETFKIKNDIGKNIKIIRFMPNTAALVSESMTCLCYSDDDFSKEEKNIAERFMGSFGKYVELPENLMNAGICANGSSPAFVYMFIEALADGVVKYGIPRDTAYQLVSQTVLGAAKMIIETKLHPAELKDKVCSPGGTTISGIAALEEYGFRNAVIKAADACYKRASDLSSM